MPRAPVRTTRTIVASTNALPDKPVVKEVKEKREIDILSAEMKKRFGDQAIIRGSEQRQPWRIPTNVFMIDLALCGGIPHNQLTMVHGPRSAGKTSLSEKIICGAQQSLPDQQVAFIDVEHTRDAHWGAKLGVNNEDLLYLQPDTGENAVDMADAAIRTREVSLVVLDSIAALVSNKEIEESADDNSTPGLQAKLVTRMCRRITNALFAERLRGHYVTLLVLNQQRSAIGKWAPHGQEALNLPGGKALEFTTMVQIGVKNKENLSKDKHGLDTTYYNEHSFKIDKCKMNAGIKSGEYQLMRREHDTYELAEGEIDDAETMLAHAKRVGIYTGGGSSWTLELPEFKQTFRGKEDTVIFLYQNRDVMWALRNYLIADHARKLGLPDYFVQYLMGE